MRWLRRIPWTIVVVTAALLVIGLIAINRAEALRLGEEGSISRYAKLQALFAAIAGVAMLAVERVGYRRFGRWAYGLLVATVVLLVAVFWFPPINGACRWIRIGPLGIQPAELAKVAIILAAARWLAFEPNVRRLRGLLAPLAITLVPLVLVLKEPDLGMALTFLPIVLAILFTSGARKSDLAKVLLVGLLAVPLVWSQMSREQRSRLTAFLEQPPPDQRPGDDAYHLHRAKSMLAMGGVWGSLLAGPTADDPGAYQLPEARTDFIFCVVGERLGLWGVALVLLLFVVLVWRTAAVAVAARDPLGRLIAAGVAAMIAVEVLINTCMTVGLLPITGLALPFLSYGGSSLLAHGIALGLVLSIATQPGYEFGNEPFRYEG